MMGGKHAAPATAYWASGMTQEQIIEVYREHHAKQAKEDSLARMHREYKRECEALGYDVDGNRRSVWDALREKFANPAIPLFRKPLTLEDLERAKSKKRSFRPS
jgi:hypothetical protein